MTLDDHLRARRREERIADFAFSTLIAAQMPGAGLALPDEEDARDLVRVAREIYSEIDRPTERPEQEKSSAPLEEHLGDDWQDGLWLPEDEPPPEG